MSQYLKFTLLLRYLSEESSSRKGESLSLHDLSSKFKSVEGLLEVNSYESAPHMVHVQKGIYPDSKHGIPSSNPYL